MSRAQLVVLAIAASVPAVFGQTTTTPFVPGVTYQAGNPNYPNRNPFYFEGRIDWNLLNITNPANAWEFAQRGIHKQDDLEDIAGAIADYQTSVTMENLPKGTCQIITGAIPTVIPTSINPPPCMFTVRLRLGNLLRTSDPATAISLFNEVLTIDPLRLGVNALIGETYQSMAEAATDPLVKSSNFGLAVAAYQAEVSLTPVTALSTQLTGDLANNAHVHWSLAQIFKETGASASEGSELNLYLQATQWHSDTYPWHIALAKQRLGALGIPIMPAMGTQQAIAPAGPRPPETEATPRTPAVNLRRPIGRP
jgi:hypothetical protein